MLRETTHGFVLRRRNACAHVEREKLRVLALRGGATLGFVCGKEQLGVFMLRGGATQGVHVEGRSDSGCSC